jgi:hypothetical protein
MLIDLQKVSACEWAVWARRAVELAIGSGIMVQPVLRARMGFTCKLFA